MCVVFSFSVFFIVMCTIFICAVFLWASQSCVLSSLMLRFTRSEIETRGARMFMCAVVSFSKLMRACVRLDGVRVSGCFEVGQGLHQGCVLAPILFNIFFTAVLNTTEERLRVLLSSIERKKLARQKRIIDFLY